MNIQELGGMKLPELKAAAKQLKIKGISTLKKQELMMLFPQSFQRIIQNQKHIIKQEKVCPEKAQSPKKQKIVKNRKRRCKCGSGQRTENF